MITQTQFSNGIYQLLYNDLLYKFRICFEIFVKIFVVTRKNPLLGGLSSTFEGRSDNNLPIFANSAAQVCQFDRILKKRRNPLYCEAPFLLFIKGLIVQ